MEREDEVDKENKGEHILREKFDRALEAIKGKKSLRIDEIPAELLNNCGKKGQERT